MNYEIIRTNRKSICIQIKNGNILVRCNKKTSIKEIETFLFRKKDWINSKINCYNNNIELVKDYHKFILGNKKSEITNNFDIKSYVKSVFKQKLDYFSCKIGVRYLNFKICSAKNKWGSCNAKGVISLNYKLIHLMEDLIDYVIIHELCHLKEFNHSRSFWNLLEKYCPKYKIMRKELKKYSCILQM